MSKNRKRKVKNLSFDPYVSGRVILNVWRQAKHELKLTNYDIENVILHLFKIRESVFDNSTLTKLYD